MEVSNSKQEDPCPYASFLQVHLHTATRYIHNMLFATLRNEERTLIDNLEIRGINFFTIFLTGAFYIMYSFDSIQKWAVLQ